MCIPGEKQTYETGISSDLKLLQAAWAGEINVVKKLIAVGADIHGRVCIDSAAPLTRAGLNSHVNVVALLLDHCADIEVANGRVLQWAAEYGRWDSTQLIDLGLIADGANYSWVFLAAESGYTGVVELVIDHGVDIHGGNNSELLIAAHNGHTDS